MSNLKLFIWDGILTSYSSGVAFALAETVDQARDLVISAHDFNKDGTNKGDDLAAYRKWLADGANLDDALILWRDLQAEPDVYDTPVGDYYWGGD